ncbi:MAG: FemAB family PEP-CTERM system-associated protein [Acidobacteriaceae bacterium]|nr:FemAB family PEP-CTERM system-associated protein [Acidobacteriaceae bacterium]
MATAPVKALSPSIEPRLRPAISVRVLEHEQVAWNDYVLSHPHGSPFHLTAWKNVVESTYGYRSYYLIACEADKVLGVLPLFLVRNLGGRALISTPFAVYGGILADSDEVRDSLINGARELGHSLGVQYVELRNSHEQQCSGLDRIERYVTFVQELGAEEESILNKIPRKTRYMVRKSLKQDLSSEIVSHLSGNFLDLYLKNLRRLGTPAFPRKHFENIFKFFRGMVDIREVCHQGKVAAAVLTLYFRDQALPYYGASDPAFSALAPNNFMYFDLMRWSGANGYRLFDFGRSRKHGSSSYEFKAHWGMTVRDLPYEIMLIRRKDLPNYSPTNSAFDLPRRVWSALPLALTRAVGPALVRLFP